MRIAAREDDDLARLDLDRRRVEHRGVAVAFGDDVIRNQVSGARQDLRQHHLGRRLLGDPRHACHDVEERRTGEADRLQHVGESVCCHLNLPGNSLH